MTPGLDPDDAAKPAEEAGKRRPKEDQKKDNDETRHDGLGF